MPNRNGAKGTAFERSVADYLALRLDDDRVDRLVKTGTKDRGDIGGVRWRGRRICIEAKNVKAMNLGGWITEAEIEAGNYDAAIGIVVHKRRGKGHPRDQYVSMTLGSLLWLLGDDEES
jgi:hypothetical protein